MMSMKMDDMFSEEAKLRMKFSKEVEFIKKRDAIEGNWMQWIEVEPKYEMRLWGTPIRYKHSLMIHCTILSMAE